MPCAFTTWSQIAALKDSDLLILVACKLGYWDGVSSQNGGEWSVSHTIGAIYRDRILFWWILDIDGVRDTRAVYCDAGLHEGQIVPMADAVYEALADAGLVSTFDTWQDAFRACVATWASVTPP